MYIRSEMIGFGRYLPEKILTNDDLSHMVETNDEWIRTRTGIAIRHIAAENETFIRKGKGMEEVSGEDWRIRCESTGTACPSGRQIRPALE